MKLFRISSGFGKPPRLQLYRAPHFSSGFTLIELTIVIVILVVLSGAATTSMKGLGAAQQNVAATRVRSVLIHAQRWAMGCGSNTWVVIDAAKETVSVFVEDPKKPGKPDRIPLLDPLTRGDMILQLGDNEVGVDSVSIGSADEVRFDLFGSPADENGKPLAKDGEVEISGGIVIRITKGTGLVEIE